MRPPPIDESLHGPLAKIMSERYPAFADELGLQLISANYNQAVFGNSILIYESAASRLRILTDRGEVRAEIASTEKPEIWWTVRELYRLIHGTSPDLDPMLNGTIAFLREHYQDLVRALGPEYAEARSDEEARKERWSRPYEPWKGHPDAPTDGWFKRLLNRFRL